MLIAIEFMSSNLWVFVVGSVAAVTITAAWKN